MRLNGVEAARGVAALLVVMFHVTSILSIPSTYGRVAFDGLFNFGRAGVDFFFVLSGFIIAYVHAGDIGRPDRIPTYARRRLWRIYPLYWLTSLAFQALLLVSPRADGADRDWPHILMGWALVPESAAPVLEVGWSLRHELLFYALFGLMLLHRRAGQAALAVWAAGIVWNAVYMMGTGTWFFTGALHIVVFRVFNIEFFFGLAVAHLVRSRPPWRPTLLLACGTVIFLATGLAESFGPRAVEWPPRHIAYALGAALVLYGLATLDRAGRSRVPAWMVAVGRASYSIYLVHVLVALVLGYGVRLLLPHIPIPIGIAFIALVTGSVLAGMVLSRVVEQPLLRWSRRDDARLTYPDRPKSG